MTRYAASAILVLAVTSVGYAQLRSEPAVESAAPKTTADQPSQASPATTIDLHLTKLTSATSVYGYPFNAKDQTASFPFANKAGKLTFRNDNGKLRVDANGDGRITEADGPAIDPKNAMIEVSALVAGKPVQFPFLVNGIQRAGGNSSVLFLSPAAALEGQYAGHTIQILGNTQGSFTSGLRLVRIFKSESSDPAHTDIRPWPWSPIIDLDGKLYAISLLQAGQQLSLTPYTGPVADVAIHFPDTATGGFVLFTKADGQQVGRAQVGQPLHLIPGSYRPFLVVMTHQGNGRFTSVSAPPQPPNVSAADAIVINAGANTINIGTPVTLKMTAAFDGQTITITDVQTTGAAGEHYRLTNSGNDRLIAYIKSGEKEQQLAKLEYG